MTETSICTDVFELIEKIRWHHLLRTENRARPRFSVGDMWEMLHQAATEKRKCVIRYSSKKKGKKKNEYVIAPYSFRSKPGGEVLFAYDFRDGRIKSFFKDSITGVKITNRKFRPKWDVEIGNAKTVGKSFYDLAELLVYKVGR